MRNHHGRFVLVACLAAATAAAQAPTLENSRFREVGPASGTAGEAGGQPADAGTTAWGTGGRGSDYGSADGTYSPRFTTGLQDGQDPDLYSLRRVFTEVHGDFMSRYERYDPQIELNARILPDQGIKNEPGSFRMLGYDLDIEARVLLYPDSYLLVGAYYQGRSYKFSSGFGTRGNATALGDETLHAAGVKLGFGAFLDENVLLEVATSPGAWSDGDAGLHHEDFDFPSHATFTLRAMDSLFFKVGARYNQVYEDAPWLPILGVSWEVVEGFRVDILAPESAELSFWPSASTGILLGLEVTGAEYHVRTSRATGNQRANVRVQEVVTYLGLVHRMNDFLSLRARAGLVVAGDYDLTSGAASFNRAEGTLGEGFLGEISLGIDF